MQYFELSTGTDLFFFALHHSFIETHSGACKKKLASLYYIDMKVD